MEAVETAEQTVCCRISPLIDTLPGSYKMEPACNHLTLPHHLALYNLPFPYAFSNLFYSLKYWPAFKMRNEWIRSNSGFAVSYRDTANYVPASCHHKANFNSQSDKVKRNWSSYQTDWDTKRLIRLYYLSFSASRVPCNAPCAIDFYFSLLSFSSWRSLSRHLSTSTILFRALKCPAGQTDAGPDQSGKVIWDASCTQAHTQTHHRYSPTHTHTHPSSVALWPACLQSHWSASTLPNGFFSSSILLHLFSLCVTQNNKCSRPRETCT